VTRRVAVLALLLLAGTAGTARADGDPASDVLISQRVFFPYYVELPTDELNRTVAQAQSSGYPVRVALIAHDFDLGAVTPLWKKPRTYAKFLAQELSTFNTDWVLIVMPNGYGIYRCVAQQREGGYADPCEGGAPRAADERALAALPTPEASKQDVATAGVAAVRALAALHGASVDEEGGGANAVAIAAVVLALLTFAGALLVLARRARRVAARGAEAQG
jgi:hypothetical protein